MQGYLVKCQSRKYKQDIQDEMEKILFMVTGV